MIYKRLGLEIPGTGGAALVLNPGQSSSTTEIPIALGYRWDILRYVRDFDPTALSELPRLVFNAFIAISGATPRCLLSELIARFHGNAADPGAGFRRRIQSRAVPHDAADKLADPVPDAVTDDLLAQLDQNQDVGVYELIFASYLSQATGVEDASPRSRTSSANG